jgi:urea transport system permease protein
MHAPSLRTLVRMLGAAMAFVAGLVIFSDLALADAASLNAALDHFLEDDYAETAAGVDGVAASSAPQAAAILKALGDRKLFFDKSARVVAYIDSDGKGYDARTGQLIPTVPGDLVRVNNRLRGEIDALIGSLTMRAADPAQRIAAADAIFKSRDTKARVAIEAALAAEQDPRVARAFRQARAAIILGDTETSALEKIDALGTIADRGDQDALNLVLSLTAAQLPPEIRAAAANARASIERRQTILTAVQNAWYGLSLGSVLLLAAIGLAITFGVMGVINMAHGEMVMLGAYTTFVVQEVFRARFPAAFDWSLTVALPAAFLVAGTVGIVIERCIIRYLYGRPLETLLATWGVSLVLQQAVRTWFGASNVQVSSPGFMSGSFDVAGLSIGYGRLWIVALTLVVFFVLQAMLRFTPLGLEMRAVTQNRRMAGSMGIATGRTDALTFALGSGIAGIAGVALSQIDNVAPSLGQSYIIDSFMVVVFGGVGNLWGTFMSAFFLGIANKFLEPFAGAVLGKILILVLLILFIQKRPRGLFALKGRAVEA